MRTILGSDSKTIATELSSIISVHSVNIKAKSAPLIPVIQSEIGIKEKTSAPSYLYSLNANDAPPFQRPGKPPQPLIKSGTIVAEDDVILMIAETEGGKGGGLKSYLSQLLVEKQITTNYDLAERNFLVILLVETIDYAAQHDFDSRKLAVLLSIYLDTHKCFKWYFWQTPASVWQYFKEVMIRHTIQDSPDGEEVFQPEECYDIMTHFHTVYMTNLPLIHILVFGCHRLKFTWPYKIKNVDKKAQTS